MTLLAACASPVPSPSRRDFLAAVAALAVADNALAAFPQPGCWGVSGPQPGSVGQPPILPPPTAPAPSPSPAWNSWDEVAYILAAFQFAAVGDYHSLYRIGFAPSVAIWGGTGDWQGVAADLADARDEAGERLLGQGVRFGGRSWAICVSDESIVFEGKGGAS